jgi:hypothetical protein
VLGDLLLERDNPASNRGAFLFQGWYGVSVHACGCRREGDSFLVAFAP